ncbi:MAG: OTU domain-containing protein [Chlamydiota bacterium]|nr:OTU domain-containing protein [Chlamydiota bacterium]
MSITDINEHLRNETTDYSMKEGVGKHNARRVFSTIKFALATIATFGIIYLVYYFKNQKKINQLKIGLADNTLVQRQIQVLNNIKSQTKALKKGQNLFDHIVKTVAISEPSYYAKKTTDAESIEGAANREREHRYHYRGLAEDFDPEEHPELFSKNSSAEHLYQSAFTHVFEELINDPNIRFSKNREFHKSGLFNQQKSAFIRLIILDLIKEAELETPACGQGNPDSHLEILKLNNNVSVSKVTSTQVYQKSKKGSYETGLMYLSRDAFTPLNDGNISGEIDPIGVKWILEKTSPEDLKTLKYFLLRSFLPEDSPLLTNVSSKIEPSNDLGYAAAMIEKIASGVEKRFSSQFNVLWECSAKDTEGNLPEQNEETPFAIKASNRVFSKKVPNKQTTNKAATVTLNILKGIGIFFANILTLGIYSIAKYIIIENRIDRLNPTTKPKRLATQKKLYQEIASSRARLDEEIKSFSENPPIKLGIVNETDPLKSHQKSDLDEEAIIMEPPEDDKKFEKLFAWRLSTPGSLVNTTMDELLHTAFDKAYEDLMELASDGEISFSRNENLKYFNVDMPNGNAQQKPLTRLVVFDLINNASLTKQSGKYQLHLNDALIVGKSQPTEIFNISTQNTERLYLDEDSWTPPPIRDNPINPIGKGIDPIGVKWLLEKLSDYELSNLLTLLLDEYYPEESDKLKEAKNFINSNSRASLNVVRAFNMICEISTSIDTRYKKLIQALWVKNANDDDDDAPMPPNKTPIDIPDAKNIPAFNRVEWVPGVPMTKKLQKAFDISKNRLSLIWDNFSEEDLLHPMRKEIRGKNFYLTHFDLVQNSTENGTPDLSGLALYNQQFYEKHELFGGGCLYGALTCSLFQETSLNSDHAKLVKNAMADYLDLHKDEYRNKIQTEIGMELPNFQNWLRAEYPDNRGMGLTDLEAEIFAYTFGIRVEIFSEQMPSTVNEDGLIQATTSYGPRTKECVFLRNKSGFSWYAAQPTLKEPDVNDLSNRAEAIRRHNLVWSHRAYD